MFSDLWVLYGWGSLPYVRLAVLGDLPYKSPGIFVGEPVCGQKRNIPEIQKQSNHFVQLSLTLPRFNAEDMVGQMKRVAKKTHKRTLPLRVAQRRSLFVKLRCYQKSRVAKAGRR